MESVDTRKKHEETIQKYEKESRTARGFLLERWIYLSVILLLFDFDISLKLYENFEQKDRQTQYSKRSL